MPPVWRNSMDLMKYAKYEYFREKNHRRGVMIAFVSPDDPDQVLIGWSLCHRKLDRFNVNIGIDVAIGRALTWSFLTDRNKYIPASMYNSFMKFVDRMKRYFKDKEVIDWTDHAASRVTKKYNCEEHGEFQGFLNDMTINTPSKLSLL